MSTRAVESPLSFDFATEALWTSTSVSATGLGPPGSPAEAPALSMRFASSSFPGRRSASRKLASSSVALRKREPLRSAPSKLAPDDLLPSKLGPNRSA